MSLLQNNKVDFIVVNAPNAHLTSRETRYEILDFQDIFVAGKNYFGLEGKKITLSQLTEYPILMLEKSSTTSEFFQQLFVRHGLSLTPEAELSSNDLLLDLARIGLGITVVPDFVLAHQKEDFYKLEIQESIPKRQLVLAHNSQISSSPGAEKFLHYLFPQAAGKEFS